MNDAVSKTKETEELLNRKNKFTFKTILWSIATIFAIIVSGYKILGYYEQRTPKLEIAEQSFRTYPDFKERGNRTGILITIVNQSNAWAKNVKIDFINDNGIQKIGKLKYFKENNIATNNIEIKPGGFCNDGWIMLEGLDNLDKYQNNRKSYNVDVFIDWEDEKGKKYSLVARYESVADNFTKQVRFKEIYKLNSFKNRKKIEEIKRANKDYLLSEKKN